MVCISLNDIIGGAGLSPIHPRLRGMAASRLRVFIARLRAPPSAAAS